MPELITRQAFTDALEATVAERGRDWIYPITDPQWQYDSHISAGCRYVLRDGSTTACLIGGILHRLGWTLAELAERENDPADVLLGALTPELDWPTCNAAGWAQGTQDEGYTWGDARDSYYTRLAQDHLRGRYEATRPWAEWHEHDVATREIPRPETS